LYGSLVSKFGARVSLTVLIRNCCFVTFTLLETRESRLEEESNGKKQEFGSEKLDSSSKLWMGNACVRLQRPQDSKLVTVQLSQGLTGYDRLCAKPWKHQQHALSGPVSQLEVHVEQARLLDQQVVD
jgi:hypothetical protein